MSAEVFNTCNNSSGVTSRILNFLANADDMFICIGKPSPWTPNPWGTGISDSNPPTPSDNLTLIPEPIIFKRVQRALPAVKSTACAELTLSTTNSLNNPQSVTEKTFTLVEPDEVYDTQGLLRSVPTLLYISTTIKAEDYAAPSFRAIGFCTNIKFKTGVDPNKIVYNPGEMASYALHWTSFNTPIIRAVIKSHHLEFLMQL